MAIDRRIKAVVEGTGLAHHNEEWEPFAEDEIKRSLFFKFEVDWDIVLSLL